jgi:hypothetical protein
MGKHPGGKGEKRKEKEERHISRTHSLFLRVVRRMNCVPPQLSTPEDNIV